MNNRELSGCDLVDLAENSPPEDVGSLSSSYDSVAKGVENQGIVLEATDNADFNHFMELFTLRVTEAGAKYWECSMDDDDRALFSSTYGFDCNKPKRMAYPKKSCAKPIKRSCAKPKPKVAKRCAKPKPKKMCAKPKPKKMCAKPKPKKMCSKPKRKPMCPKAVKPKCSNPYPGGQSVFGIANKSPETPIKEGHNKENK